MVCLTEQFGRIGFIERKRCDARTRSETKGHAREQKGRIIDRIKKPLGYRRRLKLFRTNLIPGNFEALAIRQRAIVERRNEHGELVASETSNQCSRRRS